MLRVCATHAATLRHSCCDFARPMVRLYATQISYVATLRDPCCDFARPRSDMLWFTRPKLALLRLCMTQVGYVATLRDPCCNFVRPKLAMLRIRATHAATLCAQS